MGKIKMPDKSITVRDKMDLENFDPMSIDISEFQELSKEMPQDMNIDYAIAERLASVYLRSADRASEISSVLLCYTQKLKQDKNTIRQRLYLEAKDHNHKTVEERKAFAECHPDYIKISDKLVEAEAVKKWFEDKQRWFLESHRFMKAKLKSESNHMISSGFSETAGYSNNKFGEKDW